MEEQDPWYFLVVDDSVLSRKMLARVLIAAGYRCDTAEDGQQAVEMVERNMSAAEDGAVPLDTAVVCDYEMPVKNGPDSVRQMRQLGYKNRIFGVTGNGLPDQIQYFENAGCNHVLIKPFLLHTFHEKMRLPLDPDGLPEKVESQGGGMPGPRKQSVSTGRVHSGGGGGVSGGARGR